MYSIGEIISSYRKKKGLLQQDLADELAKEGITISYKAISNWERNLAEPSVTIFYKVCRIISEKSGNSVAFTRMTLPLLSDTAQKLSVG